MPDYGDEYRNVTMNSKGIRLVIEPSILNPEDRDYVHFNIMIVNDNLYPVRMPAIYKIHVGHSLDEMMPAAFIDYIKPYIEIEARSSRRLFDLGWQVRYPEFKLYVSAGGATTSIKLNVKQ